MFASINQPTNQPSRATPRHPNKSPPAHSMAPNCIAFSLTSLMPFGLGTGGSIKTSLKWIYPIIYKLKIKNKTCLRWDFLYCQGPFFSASTGVVVRGDLFFVSQSNQPKGLTQKYTSINLPTYVYQAQTRFGRGFACGQHGTWSLACKFKFPTRKVQRLVERKQEIFLKRTPWN